MIATIVKTFQELVALLPAAVARGLLLLTLAVAAWMHYTSTGKIDRQGEAIAKLQVAIATERAEREVWVKGVAELSAQVQAWRTERDEERKELLRELRRGTR
jgi:mannitol-1-phosphate/altronate dehydrogenase